MTQISNPEFESKHDRGAGGKFTRMERDETEITDLNSSRPKNTNEYERKIDHHVLTDEGQHFIIRHQVYPHNTYDIVNEKNDVVLTGYASEAEAVTAAEYGDAFLAQYNDAYDEDIKTKNDNDYVLRSYDGENYDIFDQNGKMVQHDVIGLEPARLLARIEKHADGLDRTPDRITPDGEKAWKTGPNTETRQMPGGGVSTYRDGLKHSDNDEPSYVSADGLVKQWHSHGNLHRNGSPAIIEPQREVWYQNGHIDRDPKEGPAEEYANGNWAYVQHGVINRDENDGPALYNAQTNTHMYYKNDAIHRTNGPAVIEGDTLEYWRDGRKVPTEHCANCGHDHPTDYPCINEGDRA